MDEMRIDENGIEKQEDTGFEINADAAGAVPESRCYTVEDLQSILMISNGCCYQYVSCPWNAQGKRFGTSGLVCLSNSLRITGQFSMTGNPSFSFFPVTVERGGQGYLTLPEARGSFDPRSKRPNSDAYMV